MLLSLAALAADITAHVFTHTDNFTGHKLSFVVIPAVVAATKGILLFRRLGAAATTTMKQSAFAR